MEISEFSPTFNWQRGDLSDLPLSELINRLDLRIISSNVPYNEQILLVDVV